MGTDHCWYPNINGNDYSRCTYRQAGQESLDALRRCQQDFSRNRNQPRCNAVNCVPLFPPQQVKVNAWDSPMGGHVSWKDPSQENFNNGCNINDIPEDPAFNIETEDYWYVRDDDPEDPVYWSQCFRPEEERVFPGNVACPACESETAEVVQKWKVGHMCRTCEDVETFDDLLMFIETRFQDGQFINGLLLKLASVVFRKTKTSEVAFPTEEVFVTSSTIYYLNYSKALVGFER